MITVYLRLSMMITMYVCSHVIMIEGGNYVIIDGDAIILTIYFGQQTCSYTWLGNLSNENSSHTFTCALHLQQFKFPSLASQKRVKKFQKIVKS